VRRDVPDYVGKRVSDGSRPNKGCAAFNLYVKEHFGGDKDAALAAVKAQDGAAAAPNIGTPAPAPGPAPATDECVPVPPPCLSVPLVCPAMSVRACMRVPAHAGCVLTLCFVLLLCRMEALRAQIAALTVENTTLKTQCDADLQIDIQDKMDAELHAEIDKNKKLLTEVEKLKGPPPPPPRYART
jgi:hypothetical protein